MKNRRWHLGARAFPLLVACTWVSGAHAESFPGDYAELTVETGYLTKVKHNSPLDYRVVPTQIVWRSPMVSELRRFDDGARLIFRHRLALLTETFPRGAEDYYIGFSGAPSFELWMPNQKTALYYSIGGGFGYINSKNVPGGQGQNFTLNWFTEGGLRHQLTKDTAISGGFYFVHHSNGGMTNPNPGIDALGGVVGLTRKY